MSMNLKGCGVIKVLKKWKEKIFFPMGRHKVAPFLSDLFIFTFFSGRDS